MQGAGAAGRTQGLAHDRIDVIDTAGLYRASVEWKFSFLGRKFVVEPSGEGGSVTLKSSLLRPLSLEILACVDHSMGSVERGWSGLGVFLTVRNRMRIRVNPGEVTPEQRWGLLAPALLADVAAEEAQRLIARPLSLRGSLSPRDIIEEAAVGTGTDQLETWKQQRIETVLGNYTWAGIELRTIAAGEASVLLPCRPEFNVGGHFNGGVLSGLLELPSFLALLTELSEGETPVTNDIFVQHLRGVPADAEIILEGKLVKRGRTMAWTEARALADGKLTTLARITKTLLPG